LAVCVHTSIHLNSSDGGGDKEIFQKQQTRFRAFNRFCYDIRANRMFDVLTDTENIIRKKDFALHLHRNTVRI